MKKDDKYYVKWWFWIIVIFVFLAVVQVIFRIDAPCKWLDAVWEAGDLISFIGTLALGYIAVVQTKRANDMANDANKTSRKLIELQKAEYTPVVTVENFAGITNHNLEYVNTESCSQMIVHEMRYSDGEASVGYSISLIDKNCDLSQKTYCRDYEIHLSYSGRFVVESFQIKEIRFIGNDFEEGFDIKNGKDMSLGYNEKLTLFLFLVNNEDFTQKNTTAHKFIKASHIVFEIEMKSITGEVYGETIKIRKLFVEKPSPKKNLDDAEMLVSTSYNVQNKNNEEV